jgi:hypothetical protein
MFCGTVNKHRESATAHVVDDANELAQGVIIRKIA